MNLTSTFSPSQATPRPPGLHHTCSRWPWNNIHRYNLHCEVLLSPAGRCSCSSWNWTWWMYFTGDFLGEMDSHYKNGGKIMWNFEQMKSGCLPCFTGACVDTAWQPQITNQPCHVSRNLLSDSGITFQWATGTVDYIYVYIYVCVGSKQTHLLSNWNLCCLTSLM